MKHSMKLLVVRLVVMAGLLVASQVMAATVPKTLNFQGTLTNNAGEFINGTRDMTVRLYTVASGGTAFWEESQPGVILKNGQFSMVLGKGVALDETKQALLSGETYIGITVAPDTAEMVPRQQFTSVAYALKSGDGVPIGAIIMWSGAQIPNGWALCDGTNGTPNLKDRFVVGSGNLYALGNTGGSSTINLSHAHTVNSHVHGGVDHLHSINHDHFVSRINDGSWWSEWGHGLDTGGDFAGYTYGSITNPNSGAADRSLTTGPATPGTNNQLSAAQDVLPPYYALAFIMKVQ